MPEVSMAQAVFLGVIVVAFAAFGVILLAVSLYVSAGGGSDEPAVEEIERQVIPAKRSSSAH